jgi:hypothetical protein
MWKGTRYLLQNGNNYIVNSSLYPLFTPISVHDKSLYDWSSVNLAAPNTESTKTETATVMLEQFFLRSQRQTLAWQAGWVHTLTKGYDRRFLGTGSNLQVYIDINEKLLDGTANPYFLRPYVGASAPTFTREHSETRDYRNVLAYELDLTHEKNWLRWIGRHRFTGLTEYQEFYTRNLSYIDTISSTNSWMNGAPPAATAPPTAATCATMWATPTARTSTTPPRASMPRPTPTRSSTTTASPASG